MLLIKILIAYFIAEIFIYMSYTYTETLRYTHTRTFSSNTKSRHLVNSHLLVQSQVLSSGSHCPKAKCSSGHTLGTVSIP